MPLFGYDFENECNLRAQKNLARTQYFTDLPGALVKMLNHQAQREAGEMADTVMTRAIVEELDYGRSARANVFIAGDARYGKTRTVFTSCRMYPGRQRLITFLQEAR